MLPLLSLCVCNPTCSLRGAARSAVDCRVGSRSPLVGCHSSGRRSHLSRVRGRCGRRERTHRGVLDVLFPRLRPRRGGCRQQRPLHRHRATAADPVRRRTAGPEPDRGGEQHSPAGPRHQCRVPAGQPVSDHAGRHSRRPGDRRAAALPPPAASNWARPYVGTAPHASFGTRGHAHPSNRTGRRRVGHEVAAEAFRPGAPSLLGAAGRQPASASVGVFGPPHSPPPVSDRISQAPRSTQVPRSAQPPRSTEAPRSAQTPRSTPQRPTARYRSTDVPAHPIPQVRYRDRYEPPFETEQPR